MKKKIKTSLTFQIINIVCASLSSVLIWTLTERDLVATIIMGAVVILTVVSMLAHYVSRQHIIREELKVDQHDH